MSVIVFAENSDGTFKKAAFEAVNYAKKIADKTGGTVTAVTTGDINAEELGKYGAEKILVAKDERLKNFSSSAMARVIATAADKEGANTIIFSNTYSGKSIAPRLAAKLKAGLVSGAVDVPSTDNGFIVKKSVFSGKAYAFVEVKSDKKIIALNPNSFQVDEMSAAGNVEELSVDFTDSDFAVKTLEVDKVKGEVPLQEAELVVSGGRGLKGPENWHLIEDLAHELGAATACSRPVADSGWRPHHEHVGQTGGTIRPNLYMAIGISGAIQHLAGLIKARR